MEKSKPCEFGREMHINTHTHRKKKKPNPPKLTFHRKAVLRGDWLCWQLSYVLIFQQLLAEHITEEDPDHVDAPEVLQLLGQQGHGLIQPGRQSRGTG